MVVCFSRLLLVLGFLTAWNLSAAVADGAEMLEARGQTMGTTYSVKVFDPPQDFSKDWQQQVDRELRLVNDQMSTYLESSEISRFNASRSSDWFDVSPETAMVVAKSLEIHRLSEGAFDITVAPLVDAWSFGPGKRTSQPPEPEVVEQLLTRIGSEKLAVRLDPPAIRKSDPQVTIDLSAIAKGHGVDRVVGLLGSIGASNTFVEIGGEVRATGDKAGQPWTVGLQQPDSLPSAVAVAHPLRDQAVATSGDYYNFFEFEGRRYSHTLDPRTGRPVEHALASVSVLAADCMTADAWATALDVLGPEAGPRIARDLQLDALLMIRSDTGEITSIGSGQLAAATVATATSATGQNAASGRSAVQNWLAIAVIGAVVLGMVIAGMAVGVLFGRRAISGSCGGLANQQNAEGESSCSLCSNPSDACRELKEKMQPR